jgi:hypothetical protein
MKICGADIFDMKSQLPVINLFLSNRIFQYFMLRKERLLGVISIIIIVVVTMVTFTDFAFFDIAQGQGNFALTPEEKAAKMCDPNDIHVNTTESIICGKQAEASGSSANATLSDK